MMPVEYIPVAPRIFNMEVKDDDVWVVTFPKCGTTWMQAIVWNLMTNCDEEQKDVPMQVLTNTNMHFFQPPWKHNPFNEI